MAKLTKIEARNHAKACELLQKDRLTIDERIFVLDNWHEGANHVNSAAGAFFTPSGLARDFILDAGGRRGIDLCAGIGGLAFWLVLHERVRELVCVEINPDYIEVGRKIVPEATWIQADVFDLPELGLGHFDFAVSNPPFGKSPRRAGKAARYTGSTFEYHVMDLARDVADAGTFIVPQNSAPFVFSGQRNYQSKPSAAYLQFSEQTGIELGAGCGVDTDLYRNDWHGVSPATEIVLADFAEARQRLPTSTQTDLFAAAA